jgi:hypothetical protein
MLIAVYTRNTRPPLSSVYALAVSGLVYVLLERPIDRLLRSEPICLVERHCVGRPSATSRQESLQGMAK